MSWVEFRAGKSRVLLQDDDILAVLERVGSDGLCDVYTSAFPAGITVDHCYEVIEEMLLGSGEEELDDNESE